MKKNLLALIHGEWASHTIKIVEIAKALRDTGGYDITFSGVGEYMQKMVKPAGFDWVETPTLPKKQIYEAITTKIVPRVFQENDAERYYKVESELLEKHKPDIILRDLFREFAGVAAKKQKIYDVFVQQANCSHLYYMDYFRPSSFPRSLDKLLPMWAVHPFAHKIQDAVRRRVHKPIRDLVAKVGLPLNPCAPEGYEADLVLFPDTEQLFPFPNRKDFYKYLGPILLGDNNCSPSWLEEFREEPRKRVLITNGSTTLDDKTEMFADTFKDDKFAIAFETSGDKPVPRKFYGGHKFNVDLVLPYVDVFITHGGMGSTYFGLKNGVPMLIIPNHFEQEINGHQLNLIGAGLYLMKKSLSEKAVKMAVEKIVSDDSFRQRAMEISSDLKGKNPLELAVQYISEGYGKFKGAS